MKPALLLSCAFLAGSHLLGADIQILNVTSLGYSSQGTGPRVSFTASGEGFEILGSEGVSRGPIVALPGAPIGTLQEEFFAGPGQLNVELNAGLIGPPFVVLQLGPLNSTTFGFQITGSTDNAVVPATSTVLTFPGVAQGGFAAVSCGPFEAPPHCTGPHFADIIIDLPGTFTLPFDVVGPNVFLSEIGFTSTPIPEPSAVLLMIGGGIILGYLLFARSATGMSTGSQHRTPAPGRFLITRL